MFSSRCYLRGFSILFFYLTFISAFSFSHESAANESVSSNALQLCDSALADQSQSLEGLSKSNPKTDQVNLSDKANSVSTRKGKSSPRVQSTQKSIKANVSPRKTAVSSRANLSKPPVKTRQIKTRPAKEPDLKVSANKFREFFEIHKERHIGYESPLLGLAQAALARVPVLLLGPGGNGKSFFSSILDLIVDDETGTSNVLSRNFGPDTSKADIVGPLSPSALLNQDMYIRLHQASMAGYFGVRIEELFDASPTVVRAFHEIYDDFNKKTILVMATTNKTLDQLMVQSEDNYGDRDLPRPTLNRFPIKIVVPRDFAFASQYLHMFSGVAESNKSPGEIGLSWQNILQLAKLTQSVEVPLYVDAFLVAFSLQLKTAFIGREVAEVEEYKRNKRLKGYVDQPPFVAATYLSKRSMIQARQLLKASVVLRELSNLGNLTLEKVKPRLKAKISDLGSGLGLAPLIAADLQAVERLILNEVDPNESTQLRRAYDQIEAVQITYQELLEAANEEYVRWGFGSDSEQSLSTDNNIERALRDGGLVLSDLLSGIREDLDAETFSGATVGRLKVAERVSLFFDGVGVEHINSIGLAQEAKELKTILRAFKSPNVVVNTNSVAIDE